MSTNDSNTSPPINISIKNITSRCDAKCSYQYQYPDSNSIAKNNGVHLSLTYENGNKPPVLYNQGKYTVQQIQIVAPSLHLFDGAVAPGELIVVHVPELGGPNLLVCIPMTASGDSTAATDLIAQVIEKVANNAPSKGESTNLNITDFSLQHIIPKKPFVSYTGTYGDTPNDFIVFSTKSPIHLPQIMLSKLTSLIQPFPLTLTGGPLYLNPLGPNSGGSTFKSDDIYISCRPTGASEEKSYIDQSKTFSSTSSFNLLESPLFWDIIKFLVICTVFIVFFLGLNYGFNALTQMNISLPKFRK